MADEKKTSLQMGAFSTVAEPVAFGNPRTVKPNLGFLNDYLEKHPVWEAIFASFFGDAETESTVLEPRADIKYRGRPVICLPRQKAEPAKTTDASLNGKQTPAADKAGSNGRKTGFPGVADYVYEHSPSVNELYRIAEKQGLCVVERPYSWMQRRFGNYIGYRDGSTIYVSEGLSKNERAATLIHELFEDENTPHAECQSRALTFAKRHFPDAYKTLWDMGRAAELN